MVETAFATAVADLSTAIRSPRESQAARTIYATQDSIRVAQREAIERNAAARKRRADLRFNAERLEAQGAPSPAVMAAWAAEREAASEELAARDAMLRAAVEISPDLLREFGEDLRRTAAAIATRNQAAGARVQKRAEALLEAILELNAADALERAYFDGVDPIGRPLIGIRMHLTDYHMKLYPPVDPDVVRMLSLWLQYAKHPA
jgi:hypothetical protein